MIIEDLTAISAWGSWHLVSDLVTDGQNPMTVSQRKLLQLTGYKSNDWLYLGSFMHNFTNPDVTGHFFIARDTRLVDPSCQCDQQMCAVRWVSQNQLKYALLDGRIGIMSYAFNAAMALMLPMPQFVPRDE